MLIFSASARDLIEEAAVLLAPARRGVWRAWAEANPRIRMPGDPSDDGRGPISDELAGVILAALEAKREQMKQLRSQPELSEDGMSDLDNDISHVKSVERAIYDNLKLNRAAA